MKNLAEAIIAVMQDVKGIEKSMTVGSGQNSYKGVPDQEVKKIIGESMANNGLTILPIDIDAKTEVSRWEELDQYSKETPKPMKQKQSVFTEVHTKYLLLHTSGESQIISGYGHGVDSQDKGAGKATTYALKYALLYSFLVPTGKIDDADFTHSDQHEAPKPKAIVKAKPYMNENSVEFEKAVEYLKGEGTIEKIRSKYNLSETVEQLLITKSMEVA